MTPVQALREAREKVKKGWCQHAFAIDKHGLRVPRDSNSAVAFCMTGALDNATGASAYLYKAVRGDSVVDYNDSPRRTKAQVLAAFDRAIVLAKKERGRE